MSVETVTVTEPGAGQAGHTAGVSTALAECMQGYCRHRNLCAAAAVVELLMRRLRAADNDAEACVYLSLFRKWSYIAGCHFRQDRFALAPPGGQSVADPRPGAQILQFRPRDSGR